jgi:NTP pyrophosphatase (non-canonical NTP hydrolase)
MVAEVTLTRDDLVWWVDKLAPIYETKLRRRTPIEVWSKVTEHGSAVGEAVREANFKDLVTHLAQTLGWVVIFFGEAQKHRMGKWGYLNIPFRNANWDGLNFGRIKDLGEIVMYHYPALCPHCLGDKCKCVLIDKPTDQHRLTSLTEWRKRNRGDFDRTWIQLETRFGNLYRHDDKIKSHADIGFHFLEEIGEVVKSLRMVLQFEGGTATPQVESPTTRSWLGQLVEELADVISWSTSVIRRVKLDLENYCELCPEGISPDSLHNILSLKWALEFTYLDNNRLTSPVCPKCRASLCTPDCDEF